MSDEIDTLTADDWESLRRYAFYRMRRVGGSLVGKGPEDLLSEALLAYARGGRTRREGQPLVKHLFGIMHSIAGDWPRWEKNTTEITSGLMNRDEDFDDPV